MHEADNAYSICRTWLCYRLVRLLTVAYSSKHYVLDLSPTGLLLTFSIRMCNFDSVVSLGVELDSQAFD